MYKQDFVLSNTQGLLFYKNNPKTKQIIIYIYIYIYIYYNSVGCH